MQTQQHRELYKLKQKMEEVNIVKKKKDKFLLVMLNSTKVVKRLAGKCKWQIKQKALDNTNQIRKYVLV